ncbi:single-stranded DNA-binding protein [Spiroplasma endosymbiont of Nephrotoma flavescens]|uniref:single-stranded DNA-binding protein n=2 Tax=Spiroplasma TaxID=2132 RepID=UPI00313D1859
MGKVGDIMLNNLVLVGRIVNPPEIIHNQTGERTSKMMRLTISVTRPFKNKLGHYDEDYLVIKVWNNLIADIVSFLVIDTMIAIKARIQSFQYKDNENHYLEIIADRIMRVGHYILE